MSTLNVASVQSTGSSPTLFKNSSGTEVGELCRAWVNFDGTGTVTIGDSFNVSSITDNGTGDYEVNFTNPMSNANYCANLSYSDDVLAGVSHCVGYVPEQNASYVRILIHNDTNFNQLVDKSIVNVAVFGS